MRKALFLDRDGVINQDTHYLSRIGDCRFVDGIFDLARRFAGADYLLVVATNQSGIGRGFFSEEDFQTLMDWMGTRFAQEGAPLAAVYHCPDHPTEGLGAYRRDNAWRKPGPGMFLQACTDLDLDMAASVSLGDKLTDMQASLAAGVGQAVLFAPEGAAQGDGRYRIITRLDDLSPPR